MFDPASSYKNALQSKDYEFVQGLNYAAIDKSDVIILNFSLDVPTIGTTRELDYVFGIGSFAGPIFSDIHPHVYPSHFLNDEMVFIIVKDKNNIPIYLRNFSDFIVDSIDDIIECIDDWNNNVNNDGLITGELLSTEYEIKYYASHDLPTLIKAHKTDVGYDLSILEDITISPLEVVDVPTGVYVDLPDDVWGRLVHRSSAFRKHRILVLEGVIDPGFRGELKVCLYNLFNKDVTLYKGMKLAQLILMPRVDVTFKRIERFTDLSKSDRMDKGFGSSGL